MSSKIKLAYFGTPVFSVELLSKILTEGKDTFDVAFVVTQPDRPVGRDQIITPSPVKEFAQKHDITVYDSVDQNVEASLKKCDIALVFAYGHLINSDLLRAPK
jgi:methionyl-tRNA formyltransferase